MNADGFAQALETIGVWTARAGADLRELDAELRRVRGLIPYMELLQTAAQLREAPSVDHERWLWGALRYELGAQVLRSPGREWVWTLPACTERWENANHRAGSKWGAAKAARQWREHAYGRAMAAVHEGALPRQEPIDYAVVHIWVQPTTYRRQDLDNWAGICKRVVDALGPETVKRGKNGPRVEPGASVLAGDDAQHLSGPHRHWWHTSSGRARGEAAGDLRVKIIDLSDSPVPCRPQR